jgi:bifunctional non-homologous end joining protein LigD
MRSVTLYYTDGQSDKVYQAAIEPRGNQFIVTFAYGRRGATLQTGIKTPDPVDLSVAQNVFDKLVREKKTIGYTSGENGKPYERAENAGTFTGILLQLLNAITGEEALSLIKDPDWCMQEKKDGRRCLIRKNGNVIQGINRRGLLCSLPRLLVQELTDFEIDFVIDGEIIGEAFHAFDLLQCGDRDWKPLPYRDRLDALDALLSDDRNRFIHKIETFCVERTKRDQFKELQTRREEGVVFKLLSASYDSGRPNRGGPALKYKFTTTGSFIVAKHNDGRSVGLKLFREKQICGNVTIPPNKPIPKVGNVIEVRYLYAFRGVSLYQPVYLDVRDDIDQSDCVIGQIKFKREKSEDDGE